MECDSAYDKVKSSQTGSNKAKNMLRGAGYARGGGVGPAKSKTPQSAHSDEPGGEKAMKTAKARVAKKFADGGQVGGGMSKPNPGKRGRGGSKPRGHTKINISVGAGDAEKKQAMQAGVQLGAKMAAAKMAMGPKPGGMMPPPGAGPGGPPPGGPMPPPGAGPGGPPPLAARGGRMYASGGKVKTGPKRIPGVPHLTASAGGALGRIEKARAYGGKPIGKGVKLTAKQKI
jgi:hypothetical protein